MIILGKLIEDLCNKGASEVILVAPFIKANIIERLFSKINSHVQITCITRWRIEEILAGVSDIEIWPIIKQNPKASLLLKDNLHAKYYRIDNECLVGSANLTASALGWSKSPNLELLVFQSAEESDLKSFEKNLLNDCIKVDDDLYEDMKVAIDNLKEDYQKHPYSIDDKIEELSVEAQVSIDSWIPTLRNPDDLYIFYSEKEESLTTQAKESAISDLTVLQIPLGINKSSFNIYVGLRLLQMPIIRKVDEFVDESRRFGVIR